MNQRVISDEKTADDVNSLIMSLSSELQTSFIIVTHNHDLANRMDRILTLHNGVLNKLGIPVQNDRHDGIYRHPVFPCQK